MKKITCFLFACIAFFNLGIVTDGLAQGCVAIRSVGATCNANGSGGGLLTKGQWQVSTTYRYFKSYKHFKGRDEQPDRVANGSEVINHSSSLDVTLIYAYSSRLNINLNVPLVYNRRSSLYEHGLVNGTNRFNERHSTGSKGLGDIRLSANYWLFDPETNQKGNLSFGLGVKSNSGNYNYQDNFYNVGENGQQAIRSVDQSIQPGDGGWGLTVEMQGYRQLFDKVFVYGNAFYLANPRETNGTRTYRETLTPVLANEAIMSVPDQYMARAGVSYATPLHGLSASLGWRIEGIPVYDLVGGSGGFRRPGYVTSIEPSLAYMKGRTTLSLNVPVALVRNRTQSVTDKETERLTGKPRQGDAAFADYSVSVGFGYRFK